MPATLTAPTPTLSISHAGDSDSPAAFRAAFDFLRRHGEGRYSDRTLMAISRWEPRSADIIDGNTSDPFTRLPGVYMLATETSYDEVTEVKTGGVCSLAACLPTSDGDAARLIMATAPESRRKGYGRSLLSTVLAYEGQNIQAWVGQHNTEGMKFLLTMGLLPQEMNRTNAIMFSARTPSREQDGVAL